MSKILKRELPNDNINADYEPTISISRIFINLLIAILFCLNIYGCNSYKDKDVTWIESIYGNKHITYNPNFIFDTIAQHPGNGHIDSEMFSRKSWPTSQDAYGYVNAGEIITYHHEFSDDQYLTESGKPRNRYHYRSHQYKVGLAYR